MSRVEPRKLPAFTPPPRFATVDFAGYQPQHPSQKVARERVQVFAAEVSAPTKPAFRWPWRPRETLQGRGLYLDGSFGVGKTHLLAAAYNACSCASESKLYLSFQELVYIIGVQGVAQAKAELGGIQLFCIDEFELDDPGNTLIVKSFLAHVFSRGGFVMTTSNTPPEAQGQGRFNADDFKREIQSVAERFETLPLEGPDYRGRDHLTVPLSRDALAHRFATEHAPEPKIQLEWAGFLDLLERRHPIRYREVIETFGTLYLNGAETLETQNDALRFVHFIDKLYDLKKGLRLSGELELGDLFHPSYRESAFAKKHYRCLSRLSELLEETF